MSLQLPILGLGTWTMGKDPAQRAEEVAALRLGLDLGLTLIDTAEMYADGGAEQVVAEAVRGRRDKVFLVSKVLPGNASREGAVAACERSLARLATDRLDLYLLHWWEGLHPMEETLAAFQELVAAGKILRYGVSNFDLSDMKETWGLPGGNRVAANQVLYNLRRRGIERKLLPWCREHEVRVMAYSPLEQGKLDLSGAPARVAKRHSLAPTQVGVSAAQVALAWVLRQPGVCAIPMTRKLEHVREIVAARDLQLSDADLLELDREFPAPDRDIPLEML